MKAVILTENGQLKYSDIKKPQLDHDEVQIK